jgi:hypothetical protein
MNNKVIKKLKDLDARLNEEFGVHRIGIFGSYARGEEREGSDIDLLVEFKRPVDLFEFSRLRSFLADQLGTAVDLVTPNALKSMIKDNILKSVVYI